MQVPRPDLQHAVMIEAVENHMPEVIVIDEIGTEAEAQAARTIAERGVQLIATAHGNSLDNLLMNPTLSDLLGGIHAVTLGDEEARRRGTQKTVLERKAPPTFDTLVEIRNRDEFSVFHETASVVDAFLRGRTVRPEVRVRKTARLRGCREAEAPAPAPPVPAPAKKPRERAEPARTRTVDAKDSAHLSLRRQQGSADARDQRSSGSRDDCANTEGCRCRADSEGSREAAAARR